MPGFQITRKDDIEPFAEYFDRRITIQAPARVSDGSGGSTITWAAITGSPKWAHMEPWKGRPTWEAQEIFPHSFVRVLLRYKKTININDTMRLVYKSKTYLIRWVGIPGEARKIIEILCEELQAKGSVA
jgi:SPP1 family predicted phage head-tail adaptor